MRHRGLLASLRESPGLREVVGNCGPGTQQLVYGLSGAQKSCWAAALATGASRPLLLVTVDSGEARRVAEDLRVFFGSGTVGCFPVGEAVPLDVYARSLELVAQRLGVLQGLGAGNLQAVVTTVDALVEGLLPVEVFRQALVTVRRGEVWERDELARRLADMGYLRVDMVEAPGQFAVRGGVLDLYPLSAGMPVRVDFFDDEVESLRAFDVRSQRSVEELEEIQVGPARELLLTPAALQEGRGALEREYRQAVERLQKKGRPEAARRLAERLETYLAQLAEGLWSDGLEQFRPYFYPRPAMLLDYFRQPPLVVLDEPARLEERLERKEREQAEFFAQLLETGNALPGQAGGGFTYQQVLKRMQALPVVGLALLPKRAAGLRPQVLVGVEAKTVPSFQGKLDLLLDELRAWRKNRYAVVLLSGNREGAQALQQALWERQVEAALVEDVAAPPLPGQLLVSWGQLQKGFELPRWRLAVVSEAELSGRPRQKRPRPAFKEGARITAFSDLKVGDYVVHAQHGIGRYLGLEKLVVQNVQKDYLVIQYAGEDRLYVPTDQVGQVSRYVGAEGHLPRLNKLGGAEWGRTRQKVQQAVREMAEELLALYAARRAMRGHAFSPDTPWQREFEDAFPYEETPDQLRAIAEVKRDMESTRVMDRLLCGDVGYGKTEVALRAACKAVMDGKQVAVLVPTTVLAQQHFQTFQERFSGFPVRVAVLSRFRSPREQQEVVAGLARGEVDIVVGTHRLLSPDVRFRDLGLVIVDEEQRFGVAHKERLKVLCQKVDVLTLTATPIPRTLQMALSGVRDMSTIETPPEDRYPVQTYVLEYSPELVRDAILRELDRGGQVYYLHNRIADLDRVAATLRELVPEARWAVAHGQMREDELEQVMVDFMEGRFDVLLCTTIVENGLDIANVNTLIVEDADQLGLSQLYQLRGRVGRTNRLAYAYFTYRRDKTLSEVAEKRLAAIREFTEFGAGFKIALRDLEIRGAGNLLGAEQHGHMLAVGFDLYMRMLQEAVEELRGQAEKAPAPPAAPSVELPVDAYISDSYVAEPGLKMDLYQRLTAVRSLEELEELEAELRDRFGEPPQGVLNLLALVRLRLLAEQARVREVQQRKGEVVLVFDQEHGLRGEKLLRLAEGFNRRLAFSAAGGLSISVRVAGLAQEAVLSLLERLFRRITSLATEEAG